MAKAKTVPKVYYVLSKGNMDVSGNSTRIFAMSVVMGFVARETGATHMEDGRNILLIADLPKEGDTGWVEENVMRYVDILGATTPGQVNARVERLCERLHSLPDHEGKVGHRIVRAYMERFYLTQRAASVFTEGSDVDQA